jgi:hypothetical protein
MIPSDRTSGIADVPNIPDHRQDVADSRHQSPMPNSADAGDWRRSGRGLS